MSFKRGKILPNQFCIIRTCERKFYLWDVGQFVSSARRVFFFNKRNMLHLQDDGKTPLVRPRPRSLGLLGCGSCGPSRVGKWAEGRGKEPEGTSAAGTVLQLAEGLRTAKTSVAWVAIFEMTQTLVIFTFSRQFPQHYGKA